LRIGERSCAKVRQDVECGGQSVSDDTALASPSAPDHSNALESSKRLQMLA
jgi:hypothetical protein